MERPQEDSAPLQHAVAQRLPFSAVVSRLIDVWQLKAACEHPAAEPSSIRTPGLARSEPGQEISQDVIMLRPGDGQDVIAGYAGRCSILCMYITGATDLC